MINEPRCPFCDETRTDCPFDAAGACCEWEQHPEEPDPDHQRELRDEIRRLEKEWGE